MEPLQPVLRKAYKTMNIRAYRCHQAGAARGRRAPADRDREGRPAESRPLVRVDQPAAHRGDRRAAGGRARGGCGPVRGAELRRLALRPRGRVGEDRGGPPGRRPAAAHGTNPGGHQAPRVGGNGSARPRGRGAPVRRVLRAGGPRSRRMGSRYRRSAGGASRSWATGRAGPRSSTSTTRPKRPPWPSKPARLRQSPTSRTTSRRRSRSGSPTWPRCLGRSRHTTCRRGWRAWWPGRPRWCGRRKAAAPRARRRSASSAGNHDSRRGATASQGLSASPDRVRQGETAIG